MRIFTPQHQINVEQIHQIPLYPTGCESVSTVMALRYLGKDITVDEFIDQWLPLGAEPHVGNEGSVVGCDPWKAFPGDPYSDSGWGCFPPVIATALSASGMAEEYTVEILAGQSIESLCASCVSQDIPVVFWATSGMEEGKEVECWRVEEGEKMIHWIAPMHCLLLVGYDEENYYFNDPQVGKAVPYAKNRVRSAYETMGKQALVIY
ncbi:MAG: C39 family peptidase [Oscillospiraceae bacterium]